MHKFDVEYYLNNNSKRSKRIARPMKTAKLLSKEK